MNKEKNKVKKITRFCISCLVLLIISMCSIMTMETFASENRGNVIWLDAKGDDVVTINLNVYKSRGDSYGLEFTASKTSENPKNFTTGTYSAQGMIRLTGTDELIFRTNTGRWIGASQEKNQGLTRVPFSRNSWHNIKVVFHKVNLRVLWYLDGKLLGETAAVDSNPINAVSVFCDTAINDGLNIVAVVESTEAEISAAATETYSYVYRNVQGKNNWYFCEFGEYTEKELTYTNGQWRGMDESAYIGRGVIHPGNNSDVGVKYIAHKNGRIRLKGTVQVKNETCSAGDGVIAEIFCGRKMIWKSLVTYENSSSYNFTIPIKQGEAVSFRINKNSNLGYDWTTWTPSVEYIDGDYSFFPDEYSYYQKNAETGEMTGLRYNPQTKQYEGDGGYIDGNNVSLNQGFAVGKSLSSISSGRYRAYGNIVNNSKSDLVVNATKNGELFWEQLVPAEQTGKLDIRAYLERGDILGVEVVSANQSGEKTVVMDVEIEKIPGVQFCDASTAQGYSYTVAEEYRLSDLVGTTQGENGMSYYFIDKDKKYDMVYNLETQRWENTDDRSGGYISKSAGYSGIYTDTVMEWNVPKSGTLRIDGDFFMLDSGDGTLCRIYKNCPGQRIF